MQMSLLFPDDEFILMKALHSARKVQALVVIPLNVVGRAALRHSSLGLGVGVAAGSGSRDWDQAADSATPSTCIVVSFST
jgi:hypothetical protein